jgi:hypothetical protein
LNSASIHDLEPAHFHGAAQPAAKRRIIVKNQ